MKTLTLVLFTFLLTGYVNAGISDKDLKMLVDAVNKKAPVMIDADTQLVGASGANNQLIYKYKLVNYTADQLDKAKFHSIMKPQLIQGTCPRIKIMLDAGITAVYSYVGKNGGEITSVALSSKECS